MLSLLAADAKRPNKARAVVLAQKLDITHLQPSSTRECSYLRLVFATDFMTEQAMRPFLCLFAVFFGSSGFLVGHGPSDPTTAVWRMDVT